MTMSFFKMLPLVVAPFMFANCADTASPSEKKQRLEQERLDSVANRLTGQKIQAKAAMVMRDSAKTMTHNIALYQARQKEVVSLEKTFAAKVALSKPSTDSAYAQDVEYKQIATSMRLDLSEKLRTLTTEQAALNAGAQLIDEAGLPYEVSTEGNNFLLELKPPFKGKTKAIETFLLPMRVFLNN